MSSATISLMFDRDHSDVRLVISKYSDISKPIYTSPATTTQNKSTKITVNSLEPNTKYYYGVKINNVLQMQGRGEFNTFPAGVSNFTCAFSSCAITGSDNAVFDTIRQLKPNFFIHMGDFHYEDISLNNPELYRQAYNTVFSSPKQSNLYANIPTIYMWDDHDFGGDDATGSFPSKPAATTVYKERVPHYPLTNPNGPLYQSFVCGRIRFIITDLRSAKSKTNSTMMGEEQIQWFFNELLKPEPFKVWVSSVPWIASANSSSDHWGGFATERRRIADFIKSNALEGKVAILSGDMHGLAIDDGTNSDYSTGGGARIPVFQASPLHQMESVKGGPYKFGPYLNGSNGNQYGIMEVTDDGNTIKIDWHAKRGAQTLVSYSFSYPPPPPVTPPEVDPTPALPKEGLVLSINVIDSKVTTLNGKVSQIDDLSGLDNHLKQVTVERQPLFVEKAHGNFPAIRLDGTSSFMKVEPFGNHKLQDDMTMFLVLALSSPNSGSSKLVDFGDNGGYSYRALHKSGSQSTIYMETYGTNNGISFNVRDEPFNYFLVTYSMTKTTTSLYKNGTLYGTANITPNSLSSITNISIGRSVNGLYYLAGDIADIIVYNRNIIGDELIQIHTFLKNKWGI